MSKINSFRVINLNYNNNAIRIEDETFHLDGESTLLSLQNGGGKSVLVQMLMAPFVRKRYRDTADRPFASYFTTNKPTFLLIEWVLDGGAGYVLTGMMVRKLQDTSEEENLGKEELEAINFVHEYKVPGEYDIHHIPVIEQRDKEKKLKGFNACKLMFEGIKKEKGRTFQYFDINQPVQQRQYFERLKEYQINHTEWESIVKKVNLKESGLSELFRDAKDEAGLIEKWFLAAVESKLNKDENRMKEFADLLFKFIRQYKDNQGKMEQKDTIAAFQVDAHLIKEKALDYQKARTVKAEYEEKIAFLRNHLQSLYEEAEKEHIEVDAKIQCLEDTIQSIQYEEASYKVYCLRDELSELTKNKENKTREEKDLQQEIDDLEFKLHTYECARLYEEYKENAKEVLLLENQLDVLKKDEAELLPERNQIGYNLKVFYVDRIEKQKDYLKELEDLLQEKQGELDKYTNQLDKEQKDLVELGKKMGGYQVKVASYDNSEQDFNRRYEASLERNILRVYEQGALELLKKEYTKALEACRSELVQYKNSREITDESLNSCSRDMEDKNGELGSLNMKLLMQEADLEEFEKQIEARRLILRFLGLSENSLFEKSVIEETFEKKLTELSDLKRPLERQRDALEEEYHRLKSGKVLELPKEFSEVLHNLDVSFVFGMDWLKKNGKSEEENQKLIHQIPLLPYSIVMSENELDRLSKSQIDFYTSFPIPIIKRETLTSVSEATKGCLYKETHVSFFVVFNHHLLNEEALLLLLEKKEEEIHKVNKLIAQKSEEIELYNTKRGILRFQTLEEGNYKQCKKLGNTIRQDIENAEEALLNLRNRKEELKKLLTKLWEDIRIKTDQDGKLQNKITDFNLLCQRYSEYLEQRSLMEQMTKEQERLSKSIQSGKTNIQDYTRLINETNTNREKSKEQLDNLKKTAVTYENFTESEILNKDFEDLEARFEAITKNISEGQGRLEESLKKERERFQKAQDRLLSKEKQYELKEADYQKVISDEYSEREVDRERKSKFQMLNSLRTEISRQSEDIAVCKNKLSEGMRVLEEKYQTSELMPRERIADLEFQKRIKFVLIQKDKELQYFKLIGEKEAGYQTNLSNLTEFHPFTTKQNFSFEEYLTGFKVSQIKALSMKDLSDMRGMIIRDYRQSDKQEYEKREELLKAMETLLHKAAYETDFYHKPIERLFGVLETPDAILEQLEITLSSYEALLEKLEVDLAIIEKEKQKLMEMLMDYTKEVHKNLGKIDKNSTITIRDRQVKMLKLKLPHWDEQESIYKTRLKDMVEDITTRGLQRLKQNENIEEMLGAYITTKNLYDTVVGIDSIGIKLYKIEAQREYPISWTEVAKNSGGEGFLSAFVVLSSLLSYMRREETDLFLEREEGKVLVMDNPFAQTNAAHLLKPLMDVAKKSNTQLICLSGLGGESIYNRFDNIYILNMIGSGLQKDVQYLKGEHIKGEEEPQRIIASQVKIEDMEQIELLF